MINIAVLTIFPLFMAFAAVSDLLTMRIPNLVSIVLVVAFAIAALVAGLEWGLLAWHMASGLLVLAGGFGLFAAGWIGGGDAKLAAAIATWFGWNEVLEFLILGSILGGVLTLAILMLRRWPLPESLHKHEWLMRLHEPKQGVPYGIALAAAALHLFPASQIWSHLVNS